MTPPIDDPETLRHILANTDALLLDFDGPICSVFAGIPAPVVADQLRRVLADGGHTEFPDDVRQATDPFDVLFYAAKLGQDEARYVEAAFRAHEVEAMQTAEPTPWSVDLMHAWEEAGRALAIVSNNSAAAIETYLDIHDFRAVINIISARASADVSLLKPNPYLVLEAAQMLGVPAVACAFIGDSTTDVEAARAADVRAIAFANKPNKISRLASMRPDVLITGLEGVHAVLRR